MKKQILKLIIKNRINFWDNVSEEEFVPMSEEEQESVNKMDSELADEILNLFKNK